MKNAKAARPPDTSDGDLKPQMPYLYTGLAPGSTWEASSYENSLRFTNGQTAASCESHLENISTIDPAHTMGGPMGTN
jgi:hypothetical protein